MRVLIMYPLQRRREVFSPTLQELESRLQLVLPLYEGLSEPSLGIHHLGCRADNDGVKALDRQPVYIHARFWWGVIDPVVAEYLIVLSKGCFLPNIAKRHILGKLHGADIGEPRLSIDTTDSFLQEAYPCYSFSNHMCSRVSVPLHSLQHLL